MSSRFGFFLALVLFAAPAAAQTSSTTEPPPPIRRWFEVQTWTLYSRYRFVQNSADVTTSDQLQYKDALKARFNIDAKKRYTINAGLFTGSNFIGTWNNTGIGTGDSQTVHFIKQLFVEAAPFTGIDAQYGGLYIAKGETSDMMSYDEDGYLVGERLTIRRPKELFFDEISGTRGLIGPFTAPAIGDRWRGLHEANYGQVLVAKRVGAHVRTSADYTNQTHQAGNDTIRAAIAVSFPRGAALDGVRYEQYWRFTGQTGAGFALFGDRQIAKRVRLQAGYITIDEFYIGYPADRSGWNSDRIQRGRRIVLMGNIPITSELSVAPYYTHAFHSPYSVSLKDRFDLVLQFDLLHRLRDARIF